MWAGAVVQGQRVGLLLTGLLFRCFVINFTSLSPPAPMAERSLADDCSSLCLEKLGSNPSQGGKWFNLSG